MTTEPTTRFRLDIAYQGTDFNGWALQPGLRTVQGELESAIATIFRRYGPVPALTVAGRTDAGVHAVGQVAHVDLTGQQVAALLKPRGKAVVTDAATALARRVNGILGPVPDIVLTAVTRRRTGSTHASRRCGAATSTASRTVSRCATRSSAIAPPGCRPKLDVESMDAAALSLLGLHDFASYCKPRDGATTIRTLLGFGWRRDTDGVLVAEVKADAFCHSMVRALVGGCVTVGEGKLRVEDLVTLRDERERTSAFRVMPARGLTLMQVGYPEDIGLAIRAAQTRALRSL